MTEKNKEKKTQTPEPKEYVKQCILDARKRDAEKSNAPKQ